MPENIEAPADPRDPDELVRVYAPKAFRAIEDNAAFVHIRQGFHPSPLKRSTAEHPYSRAMGLQIIGEGDIDFQPRVTPLVPQDFDGSFAVKGAVPEGWLAGQSIALPIELLFEGGKVRGMRLAAGSKFALEATRRDDGSYCVALAGQA